MDCVVLQNAMYDKSVDGLEIPCDLKTRELSLVVGRN